MEAVLLFRIDTSVICRVYVFFDILPAKKMMSLILNSYSLRSSLPYVILLYFIYMYGLLEK